MLPAAPARRGRPAAPELARGDLLPPVFEAAGLRLPARLHRRPLARRDHADRGRRRGAGAQGLPPGGGGGTATTSTTSTSWPARSARGSSTTRPSTSGCSGRPLMAPPRLPRTLRRRERGWRVVALSDHSMDPHPRPLALTPGRCRADAAPQAAVKPLSTNRCVPLTKLASSLARNSAAAATSSGSPMRPCCDGQRRFRHVDAELLQLGHLAQPVRRADEAGADRVAADVAVAVLHRDGAREHVARRPWWCRRAPPSACRPPPRSTRCRRSSRRPPRSSPAAPRGSRGTWLTLTACSRSHSATVVSRKGLTTMVPAWLNSTVAAPKRPRPP